VVEGAKRLDTECSLATQRLIELFGRVAEVAVAL
jgi:hypothetical protein